MVPKGVRNEMKPKYLHMWMVRLPNGGLIREALLSGTVICIFSIFLHTVNSCRSHLGKSNAMNWLSATTSVTNESNFPASKLICDPETRPYLYYSKQMRYLSANVDSGRIQSLLIARLV